VANVGADEHGEPALSVGRANRGGGDAARSAGSSASASAPGPGKQTLTGQLDAGSGAASVQRRAAEGAPGERDGGDVHRAAAHGTSGGATALPHVAQIQQSFGRHDVGGIRAHVGGRAAQGAEAMGAHAFAVGDHVAFAGAPDLHTAAHEAAHVVQQRGGVQLKGGVGEVGDPYERHADAVADLVVQGKSSEALLDQHAPAGAAASSGAAVQRYAFITGTQLRRTDPMVSGAAMMDMVTDQMVRDYTTPAEFKNHAAGTTDHIGNLDDETRTWLRFPTIGLNVLGEMHETESSFEHVRPAVNAKKFISEAISSEDMPKGSQLDATYQAEHADRYKQFGIENEKDKKQFGAEPLLPKVGFAMTGLMPYLKVDPKAPQSVKDLTSDNYAGKIGQSLLKEGWAYGTDIRTQVALERVAFVPVAAKRGALADTVDSLFSILDPFITALAVHGFLGDPLSQPKNAPLIVPLRQFIQALIDALVEVATGDPSANLSAAQQKKLSDPKAGNEDKGKMFLDWRNRNIANAVKDAAARGVRYAGMGWAHMKYLQDHGAPAGVTIFDMNGDDITAFENHTNELKAIAVKP
jgi:hypothetical protein